MNFDNILKLQVIIPAAEKKYMTGKIPYFFRQNSDFFYLTGCLEPESVLVLWSEDRNSTKSVLFMRPKNNHEELWDGPRTGDQQSIDFFGVDEAYPLQEFPKFYEKFVSHTKLTNVWYGDSNDRERFALTKIAPSNQVRFSSPTEFLHELRLIKSEAEADLMRRTCEIASDAVNRTMKKSKPGDSEHHIHARVDYYCRMKNASFLAYPPVVAAGNNANTIHYINNTQTAKDGEMVLMDAGWLRFIHELILIFLINFNIFFVPRTGCEYGGYSSDITRTWPVNGEFSVPQAILYDVVYAVQMELLNALSSSYEFTLDELFNLMCVRLGKYLQEIGVIDKSLGLLEASQQAMFKFCPHHVSHYLGMDIHDTPLIDRDRKLVPGMVFTVEPGEYPKNCFPSSIPTNKTDFHTGLYIPANCKEVPEVFRGIGIRIEDDVLYTGKGIEVLTDSCIKDRSKLRQLIASDAK